MNGMMIFSDIDLSLSLLVMLLLQMARVYHKHQPSTTVIVDKIGGGAQFIKLMLLNKQYGANHLRLGVPTSDICGQEHQVVFNNIRCIVNLFTDITHDLIELFLQRFPMLIECFQSIVDD